MRIEIKWTNKREDGTRRYVRFTQQKRIIKWEFTDENDEPIPGDHPTADDWDRLLREYEDRYHRMRVTLQDIEFIRAAKAAEGSENPSAPSPPSCGGEGQDEGETEEGRLTSKSLINPHPNPLPYTARERGAEMKRQRRDFARKLRKQPTWAETQLWKILRGRRFSAYKFRRQYPVGSYFLDFYCVSKNLAVELDGDPHGIPSQHEHDKARDAYLKKQGIRVLRFWNIELKENRESVLERIYEALNPAPSPPAFGGEGRGEGDSDEGRRATGSQINPHPDPLPYTARERGAEAVPSPPSCGGEGQDEGAGFRGKKPEADQGR